MLKTKDLRRKSDRLLATEKVIYFDTVRYLPISVYFVVSALLSWTGTLLLLWGPDSFKMAHRYVIRHEPYWLSPELLLLNLILVFCAPAVVVLGYVVAMRKVRIKFESRSRQETHIGPKGVLVPWTIVVFAAFLSVLRGGGLSNASTWLNGKEWIAARWQLFDTLGFFEFVNIYGFLPIVTTVAVLWAWQLEVSVARRLILAGLCLPVLLVDVLIFQKKAFLITLILLAMAIFVYRQLSGEGWRREKSFGFLVLVGAAASLVFAIMVLLPKE